MLLGAITGTLTQGETAVSRPPTADEISSRCVANTVKINLCLELLQSIYAASESIDADEPVIQTTGLTTNGFAEIEESLSTNL